jgi:hypothetical protein
MANKGFPDLGDPCRVEDFQKLSVKGGHEKKMAVAYKKVD